MKQFIVKPLTITILSTFALLSGKASFAYTLTNNSPYYLYEVNKDAGCPGTDYSKPIKPGDTVSFTASWCGFDACTGGGNSAGNGFSSDGCLEASTYGGKPNVQGGYATWFSVSQSAGCGGIAASNTYSCSYDSSSGKFNLNFTSIVQKYSAGPNVGQPVTVGTPVNYSSVPYRGINISGLEYDGTYGDALYQKPDVPEMQYFIDQKMNTVRLPIRWEFVVSDSTSSLVESHNPTSAVINTEYMKAVLDTTQKYLDNGLTVIVDLHNYMRFCDTGETEGQSNEPTNPSTHCSMASTTQMNYIWATLTAQFKDLLQQYPNQLAFGLMNEPNSDSVNSITTQQVFDNEVAAYNGIRTYEAANSLAKNLVIFSGNNWDPLHDWTSDNGQVFTMSAFQNAGIDVDNDNIALEMHQYFDSNYSGLSSTCNTYTDANDFATQLHITDVAAWLNDNHLRALLTEFGAADNATCTADLNYMLDFVQSNAYGAAAMPNGGFIGWTAWRVNRHGQSSSFNYLQQGDYNVYGGNGSPSNNGTGITLGAANGLMASVFKPHLQD